MCYNAHSIVKGNKVILTMLHRDEIDCLVQSKIKGAFFASKEEVIDLFGLDKYVDDVKKINPYRADNPVKRNERVVNFGGKAFLIDQFGTVTDSDGHPYPVTKHRIAGIEWHMLTVKGRDGKWHRERLIVLMLKAHLNVSNLRSVRYKIYDTSLPCILSNYTYEIKKPKVEITESMRQFRFRDQAELDGYLWTHNINTVSKLCEKLHIPYGELDLGGLKVRRVIDQPENARYSGEYDHHGKKFKFNEFGGVLMFRRGAWVSMEPISIVGGKLCLAFIDANGKPRMMPIANAMARYYTGETKRHFVKHIDSNIHNTILRNLYWKDCGRKPYFE